MALTGGLVAIKAGIVVALGPLVGLKRSESVRTGFVLSQGGEFAFVVFTLANQLQVRNVTMLARWTNCRPTSFSPRVQHLRKAPNQHPPAWRPIHKTGGW
jgi:Kef-type K+ transport system membrane component KefB